MFLGNAGKEPYFLLSNRTVQINVAETQRSNGRMMSDILIWVLTDFLHHLLNLTAQPLCKCTVSGYTIGFSQVQNSQVVHGYFFCFLGVCTLKKVI